MKRFIRLIVEGFSGLLLWLERHVVGILATISIHLLIVALILTLKISSARPLEYSILVDPTQLLEEYQQQEREEVVNEIEPTPESSVYNQVRNVAVNRAEQQAVDNIRQMEAAIKEELNITDPTPSDISNEDAVSDVMDTPKEDKKVQTPTVYKGETTVSYNLENRHHISLPIPVYRCKGSGIVVVKITVNNKGYVIQTELDKGASSTDPCLIEEALKYARISRFNSSSSAPAKQQGTIQYNFQAQ